MKNYAFGYGSRSPNDLPTSVAGILTFEVGPQVSGIVLEFARSEKAEST